MEKIGYVISDTNGKAVIDLRRASACGDKCATCKSNCEVTPLRVELKNTLNAKKGDFVEVEMSTEHLLKSTFILYTIPLLIFTSSLVIFTNIFKNLGYEAFEVLSILTGFGILSLTYFFIKRFLAKKSNNQLTNMEMKNILK